MSRVRSHQRTGQRVSRGAGLLIAVALVAAAGAGCAGQLSAPAIGLPTITAVSPSATSADIPSPAAILPSVTPSVAAPEPTPPPVEPSSPEATPEPAPPPAETAAEPDGPAQVLPASRPVRLQIPAIGVDSSLLDLGLKDDGTMQVPPDAEEAGWYTGAPTPGELGPAIIVAHVDWGGELGVFYYLRDLRAGDEITVTREDGSTAVFRTTSLEQFDKSQFPTDAVYGNIDHAGLRLITCGGEFDPQARSYLDNIIAFADLVPS